MKHTTPRGRAPEGTAENPSQSLGETSRTLSSEGVGVPDIAPRAPYHRLGHPAEWISLARDAKANDQLAQSYSSSERKQVYYIDGAGVAWRAYERRRPGQKPALVFESTNAIRLVRDYPANWHTLPRAALE